MFEIFVYKEKMSQEKQHHHLFHHNKEEDSDEQVPGQSVDKMYGAGNVQSNEDMMYGAGNVQSDEYENALKEEKHHKHMEELGGLGAAATGEFALVT